MGSPTDPVPVFLCIDLEPVERLVGPSDPEPWRGVDTATEYLEELRPQLAEASGEEARFLWFVRCDPQIETAYGSADDLLRRRSELLDRLAGKGDQIGVHVHGYRWDEEATGWVADFGDPTWAEHCVQTAFDTYRAHFGVPCELHRFGDRWLSTNVVELLKRLGTRFDLSVEPGQPGATTLGPGETIIGSTADYTHAPREPYRPLASDFLAPDPASESALWMIPLTAANPSSALPIARRIARKVRFLFQSSHRPLTPFRAWKSPQAYWDLVERHLNSLDRPYLALAIRSGDPDGPDGRRARAVLEHLPGHPLASRLRFADPESGLRDMGIGYRVAGSATDR